MSKGNPFIPSVFLSFHLSCISFFFPFYAISFIKKTLITDKTVVWGSRCGQCFWRMTPCSLKFGNIFYHWVIDVLCDLVLYFFLLSHSSSTTSGYSISCSSSVIAFYSIQFTDLRLSHTLVFYPLFLPRLPLPLVIHSHILLLAY